MEKMTISVPFRRFQSRFRTEADCRAHLFKLRWPNGFVCPVCGNTEYYYLAKRTLLQCRACAHQTSVTAGTVMHRTRTPLRVWFWAIYLTANDKRGLSALQLSKNLDVSYYVAWTMLHKIRKAMKDRDADLEPQAGLRVDRFISGAGPGGDKGGRGAKKTLVTFIASQRGPETKFIQMRVVNETKNEETVEAKSSANGTNSRRAAGEPRKRKAPGRGSRRARIEQTQMTDEAREFRSWTRIISSNARSFLLGTFHGIGGKHLQKYLDEFCYRFNRRCHPNIFDRLITACGRSTGLTYTELTL